MNSAGCTGQVYFVGRNEGSSVNDDNYGRKMLRLEERYHPMQLTDKLPDCKFMSNNINIKYFVDNFEYVCNVNMEKVPHREGGSFHVVPNVPLNLMPPPPHTLTNNNDTYICNFNRRGSWKSRGELKSTSPHDSESDDSCQSFNSRYSPLENGSRKNVNVGKGAFYGAGLLSNKHSSSAPSVFCAVQNQHNHNYNHKPRYYSNNSNRTKWVGKKQQPHEIYRRVYGLMERFTSHSHLLRVTVNPSVLSGMCVDQLSQSIWDVFCAKAQKEETYVRKLELWRTVYLHIRKILLRYGLFMVGSSMSGLGTEQSDIDMCLLVKPCMSDPRSDALGYLQSIQYILRNCDFVVNPEVIMAKVPILKFKDPNSGFEVDLNCNNAVGIRNTHLLHCYAHLDWRVRPLVIVVKLWAQANDINDAKRMRISSYSLALMVIHYLQCGVTPPAIPCLHGLYPNKFSSNLGIHNIDIQEELPPFYSDNKQSLGELFLGFLRYYTFFDYDRYAISVREGTVLLKEGCRMTRSQKNNMSQWKLLCIEEPFDLTNTARSVYDVDVFELIKKVFEYSYKRLNESKNLNSILSNVRSDPR